jgi:hypothetical protein
MIALFIETLFNEEEEKKRGEFFTHQPILG